MTDTLAPVLPPDHGLACLVTLLRYHGSPADPGQIRHGVGHNRPLDAADLIRLGRAAGLKARSLSEVENLVR